MRLIVSLFLFFTVSAAADSSRYAVIVVGTEAGEMVIARPAAGRVEMTYFFNDRGRGPEIEAAYTVNGEGIPVSVEVRGVDYMKAPVEESLHLSDGDWQWQSSADAGSSATGGFYSSLDGPPGELDLLIRALLNDEDATLPVLPQGSVSLEIIEELEIEGVTLRHAEIAGLGLEPQPVWIGPDGGLFAIAGDWLNIVPEDRKDVIDALRSRQEVRRNQRYRAIAEAAISASVPTLIDNARIFDVISGQVHKANALIIRDGRIDAMLGPEDARPQGLEVVDAHGMTLLPGLWDMHTHVGLSDGPLHLAAGVTTVRDLANNHDNLMNIEQAWASGAAPGPHLFRAGIIDGGGPFAGPTKARVETEQDATRWIDFYAEHGYQQIKIYSSVPVELVEGMVKRAHGHGMRVSGHIPAGMWAEDAVRSGYDEIQHINMVFLNFYKDVVETRNPDRFIKVAERGAALGPADAPFRNFVELLLQNRVTVDPTVAVLADLFTHEPGQLKPSLASAAGRLPPELVRGNLKGGLPVPQGWEARYEASTKQILVIIKALHDAGVPLVAGTDGFPGFTLQAELAYYQQAGIAPEDILRLVTIGSAEVMGVADEVGSIAPGQRADLILVDGRPDGDIADIQKVRWVMKSGQPIDPNVLYQAMSIQGGER